MIVSRKTVNRSKLISLEALVFLLRPLHTSLFSLIIVRLFSPELWGRFVFFLIIVELINTVINWGQKPFLMKAFSLSPSNISLSWVKAIFTRIFLMFLAFLVLALFPYFRDQYWFLVIWIGAKTFSVMFDSLIQFHRKYLHSILAEAISILVSLALIYSYESDINLRMLIIISCLSSAVKGFVLLPLTPRFKISLLKSISIRTELVLALPFFALSIAGLLQSKLDLYTVAYFLNENEIALYQVIIGFLILGQTFSAIVLGPFQKNIYRIIGSNFTKIKKTYIGIGFVASSIFSILLFILLKYFYLFSLDLELIPLFLLYLLPLYFYLIESQILLKYKEEHALLIYTVISGGANLFLSVLFVPTFGIKGALLSGIICRVILAIKVVNKSNKIKTLNDF